MSAGYAVISLKRGPARLKSRLIKIGDRYQGKISMGYASFFISKSKVVPKRNCPACSPERCHNLIGPIGKFNGDLAASALQPSIITYVNMMASGTTP